MVKRSPNLLSLKLLSVVESRIQSLPMFRAATGVMTTALFPHLSMCVVGATVILLGAASVPSQATTLTGFTTYGDMMGGMHVTATFLDGSAEKIIWGGTGKESGGAFGNGWFLRQSGNTYDSPWTFRNLGQAVTSLVIDAIPGNTVFDNYPLLKGPLQTDGSAEGWSFQPLVGQTPNLGFAYSNPIDISKGDLFGTLSLYWGWGGGFTGTLNFRADTDSGSNHDPVRPRDPVAWNAPPTLYFSPIVINEGESASASLYATDPGEDAITFFLDGRNLGTDFARLGTRSASTYLGLFPDNGEHPYTAIARDEDGNYSTPVTSPVTVLNVAPTLNIFTLSSDVIYEGESIAAYLMATDPGADWQHFFINGGYVGTNEQTSGERWLTTDLGRIDNQGVYDFTSQAQDKDGAFSNILTKSVTVLNLAPSITQLTNNLLLTTDELFDFSATAIDPGIHDILTYEWDFNMDGIFDDFLGATGQWSFPDVGVYDVGVRVSDGDGGDTYGTFRVETVAAQPVEEPVVEEPAVEEPAVEERSIPEPNAAWSLLGFAAVVTGLGVKGKRQHNS